LIIDPENRVPGDDRRVGAADERPGGSLEGGGDGDGDGRRTSKSATIGATQRGTWRLPRAAPALPVIANSQASLRVRRDG